MWHEKNINAWLAVFFVILVAGFLFHQSRSFPGSAFGHGLGIIGGVFILMTLIYPFRKRILKKRGKQNPLATHITYGLIGASLVVIHSGHKFSSLIGILLFLSLLLVVLSGIAGRYLFKSVNRSLKEQKRSHGLLRAHIKDRKDGLVAACRLPGSSASPGSDNTPGMTKIDEAFIGGTGPWGLEDECDRWIDEVQALAEIEYTLKFFDRIKRLFERWLRVHHMISALLFALLIVHIMTTLYYGLRWLP